MELHLTVDIPPSVNHYLGYRGIIRGGKPLAVSYVTPETNKYKTQFREYLTKEVERQHWALKPNKTQHFYVDTVFYFDRIDRDGNNYFKVLLDAITETGLIWLDDNVALERVKRIYYDAKNPRMELIIKPVEYIGIFDSASQLDIFISRCIGCTRFKRNCSILRNAKAGKIQDDISNFICSKFKSSSKSQKKHYLQETKDSEDCYDKK